MVDIKKILANSSPEAIQKIKEIVNEKTMISFPNM